MKKISLVVIAVTVLAPLGNALVVEDLFPSLAKHLETSESWEFVSCFGTPAGGVYWQFAFEDKEMRHRIRFKNEFREQTQGATTKERLVTIHSGGAGISYNDAIPPNEAVEKNVIRLIRTAIAASENDIDKAFMETAIEALQDRTQTWQRHFEKTRDKQTELRNQKVRKDIEAAKNWSLVNFRDLGKSRGEGTRILTFWDRDSKEKYNISILPKNHVYVQNAQHKGQVFSIDTTDIDGAYFSEAIEPNETMEKNVVRLLQATIATSDNAIDKQIIEAVLAVLQERDQTLEQVHERFAFTDSEEVKARAQTAWEKYEPPKFPLPKRNPDTTALFTKALEASKNWELLNSFLQPSYSDESFVPIFEDKDSGVRFALTFLHRNPSRFPLWQEPPYAEQVLDISMKSPDDTINVWGGIVEPGGDVEKKLIALLRDAIDATDVPWDKELMEFCIDLLQNRKQTWEHVVEQFTSYRSKKSR